jgi:hypothetical protein
MPEWAIGYFPFVKVVVQVARESLRDIYVPFPVATNHACRRRAAQEFTGK